MSNEINYKDNLNRLDRNLSILMISIIIIFGISILSEDILQNERTRYEYEKVSEFLDNNEIFSKYLNQKRDLYSELNRVAFDSTEKKAKNDTLAKYSISFELFGGIKGPWGWDTYRLDDRYNFQEMILTAFLNDFSFWSVKLWTDKKLKDSKGVQLPDSTVRNIYDMERRLYKIIKDRNYIGNFFAQNLDIKLTFFKDIVQKYGIRLQDTLSIKYPPSVDEVSFNLKNEIYEFLNDSTRTTFNAVSLFFIMGENLDFQEVHKTYESFCTIFFHKYIKEKYTVYDKELFKNKLPYTSYINKMRRMQMQYSEDLKNILKHKTQIDIPLVKIELDMILFYKFVFWIIFIFVYITKNILIYREYTYKELKIISNPGILHKYETPNILNIILLNCSEKQLWLKLIFSFVYISIIITLLFGINLKYYDIIYHSVINFLFLCIIPLILIALHIFYIFQKVKLKLNQ